MLENKNWIKDYDKLMSETMDKIMELRKKAMGRKEPVIVYKKLTKEEEVQADLDRWEAERRVGEDQLPNPCPWEDDEYFQLGLNESDFH